MSQFVADHRTDAAKVHGIVGLVVIKRRLENSRWERDVIELRIVAGIDRTRRIGPVILVHRLADFIELTLKIKLIRPLRITQRVITNNF